MTLIHHIFGLLFIHCCLQKMRLYSVVFDFYHNNWVIFNSYFPYKCTRSTFLLVRRYFQTDVCPSPTFVPWSDIFYCSTFVPSDVCGSVCVLVSIFAIWWCKPLMFQFNTIQNLKYPFAFFTSFFILFLFYLFIEELGDLTLMPYFLPCKNLSLNCILHFSQRGI